MSTSSDTLYFVRCDECLLPMSAHGYTRESVRLTAKAIGWLTFPSGKDVCPACQNKRACAVFGHVNCTCGYDDCVLCLRCDGE